MTYSVMASTCDFESYSLGSNPSTSTNSYAVVVIKETRSAVDRETQDRYLPTVPFLVLKQILGRLC